MVVAKTKHSSPLNLTVGLGFLTWDGEEQSRPLRNHLVNRAKFEGKNYCNGIAHFLCIYLFKMFTGVLSVSVP
jgi:hypothetical protein